MARLKYTGLGMKSKRARWEGPCRNQQNKIGFARRMIPIKAAWGLGFQGVKIL
jgi:hypothetical protein